MKINYYKDSIRTSITLPDYLVDLWMLTKVDTLDHPEMVASLRGLLESLPDPTNGTFQKLAESTLSDEIRVYIFSLKRELLSIKGNSHD